MNNSAEKEIKEILQHAMEYLYTNGKAVTETIDGKNCIMSVVPIGQKVRIDDDIANPTIIYAIKKFDIKDLLEEPYKEESEEDKE